MSAPLPSLGVVIVSYQTRDLLDDCLRSVFAALAARQDGRAQVWVVDNASTDGSAALVRERHPEARLVALERNVGFTAGNNRLLGPWARDAASCPERILLLNPDAALLPGSLEALEAALSAREDAAVVGPALAFPDGRFQHAAFRFPGLVQTALDLWPMPRLAEHPINGRYPMARYEAGTPFPVDFVLGACMLLRGRALREVGPLDEGFFMYCEEIDWCRRALQAGWRSYCVPDARVLHHGGAASGRVSARSFRLKWESRLRYARKHEPAWKAAAMAALVRAGMRAQLRRDARAGLEDAERARRAEACRAVLAAARRPGRAA